MNYMFIRELSNVALLALLILSQSALARSTKPATTQHASYRTVKVDGLSIFYREAGPKDAPTLLLLHGLPSSSRMFGPLFTRLADQFHMIAPRLPRFRPQRCPVAKGIYLHLRQYRQSDESLHRNIEPQPLHPLYAGLRRPGWVSHGAGSSR